MERDDDLIVFGEYANPMDANFVKGLLETNGVDAGVVGDSYANVVMMQPMRVVVRRRDKARAQAIVDSAADETNN